MVDPVHPGRLPGRARVGVLIALFAVLLLGSAYTGPDYARYEDWGIAGLTGDLSHARVATISPMGVPLMMWSHGTGFVFGAARLLSGGVLEFRTAATLAGWLGALVLWAAMVRVLWIVSRRDATLTLLGAALFFLATHGGYFSYVHASESLGLVCAGVLVWLAFEEHESRVLPWLAVGVATALLLTIKSYWVVYSVPAIAVLALRARRSGSSRLRVIGMLVLAGVPVALGAAQTAFTNRWMTGSPFTSSYHFGDGSFSSFDFADPEIAAVLIHPWHGLLSYHPFYALGAIALVLLIVRPGRSRYRVFFALGALAILANLYIQAAWVVWWLGARSFGMRGVTLAAAIVVPAFVMLAARLRRRQSALLWPLLVASVACSLWSWLLLQGGTVDRFFTYAEMLQGQQRTLQQLTLLGDGLGALVFFAVAAWLCSDLWRGTEGRQRALALTSLALVSLALLGLARRAHWVLTERSTATLLAGLALIALATVVAAAVKTRRVEAVPVSAFAALVVLGFGLFVVAAAMFFRLAVRIEADIAAGRRPDRNYAYVNTFSTRDMKDSCNEYRHLPEFADKREALKAFLIRHGVGPGEFR